MALEWVEENAGDLIVGSPTVLNGEVMTRA